MGIFEKDPCIRGPSLLAVSISFIIVALRYSGKLNRIKIEVST